MRMGAAPRGHPVSRCTTNRLAHTAPHTHSHHSHEPIEKKVAHGARAACSADRYAPAGRLPPSACSRGPPPPRAARRGTVCAQPRQAEVRTRGRGWRSSKAVRSSRRARHAPCASRRRRRAPWLARRRPSQRSTARLPLRAAPRGTFRREVKVHINRQTLGDASDSRSSTPTLAKIGACVVPRSTPSCSPGVHSLSSLERLLLHVRGEGGHDLTHLRIRNRPE